MENPMPGRCFVGFECRRRRCCCCGCGDFGCFREVFDAKVDGGLSPPDFLSPSKPPFFFGWGAGMTSGAVYSVAVGFFLVVLDVADAIDGDELKL